MLTTEDYEISSILIGFNKFVIKKSTFYASNFIKLAC